MRSRKTYSSDMKLNAVLMVKEEGKSVKSVADELNINELLIYNWIRKFESNGVSAFKCKIETSSGKQILSDLKKENAVLKQEIAILKKAVTIIAKDMS